MAHAVCKYSIGELPFDIRTFNLPIGTEIVKVALQNNNLTIWVIKPTHEDRRITIQIRMCITDELMFDRNSWQYLDTVFEGFYVAHIFTRGLK